MAIQPRFRVYDYFHIYWSNFKILFYACVVEGCSASLTIAREKQTSNLFNLRWSSVENRVSRDVLTGKVYYNVLCCISACIHQCLFLFEILFFYFYFG